MSSYVGHAIGANQVTESLSTAFGAFALGGTAITGVLLGVGAIVAVYERLTEESRKAKKEQDALIASLEKSIELKALGPGGETVAQVAAAQRQADALKAEIDRLQQSLAVSPRIRAFAWRR